MTKLQQKLLEQDAKRKENTALFAKYPDVGDMPAEEVARVKSNNDALATMETEIQTLTDLETQRTKSMPAHLHAAAPEGEQRKDDFRRVEVRSYPRVTSLKSFRGEVGGRKADERAYRFAKWFKGQVLGVANDRKWCEDHGVELKAMSEGNNVLGGYLVPQEFSSDIIDLREEYGVARRVAKVVPMGEETRLIPRRRSGLTAYWVGEATAITASDKNWDQVQLVAKKLGCLALFSSELSEDALVNIGDDLAGEIAYAFAYAEDNAYFNGDGTSTYGGITGARQKLKDVSGTIANIKGLKVGTGNAYSELVLADFHGTIAKLPLYARTGAKWVVSTTFFDTVMHPLQTAAGGNTVVDIANGGQTRFLGYPVEFSQVMPTTEANSQVAALLGNFMLGSTIGDRRTITIALSSEYKFAEDQLAIKGTERIDMVVHDVGDTTNAGPICGLIMAAA